MSNKSDRPIDVLKMSVWEEELLFFFFQETVYKETNHLRLMKDYKVFFYVYLPINFVLNECVHVTLGPASPFLACRASLSINAIPYTKKS